MKTKKEDVVMEDANTELQKLREEMEFEKMFVARFGNCTEAQRQFYIEKVLEPEKRAEEKKKKRLAYEESERIRIAALKEQLKEEMNNRKDIVVVVNDRIVPVKDGIIRCPCGGVSRVQPYFESWLYEEHARKNTEFYRAHEDLGLIVVRKHSVMNCDTCDATHTITIIKLPA